MATREQKDAVTVGEIRKVMSERLEGHIDTLANLIRQGYHKSHIAEEHLSNTIGETLTQMDNLDSFAGLALLGEVIQGRNK